MVLLTKAGTFRARGSSKFMTDKLNRFWPLIASVSIRCPAGGNAAQSAATLKEANPGSVVRSQTAEQLFADAPDGVDPVVTGPVSASFKQKQQVAGCDSAVWPKFRRLATRIDASRLTLQA